MKRMLILAGLAAAMLFLPACSSQESSTSSPALPGYSTNWRGDGTYVIDRNSAQSVWEFVKLIATKKGVPMQALITPAETLNLATSQITCMTIGMILLSFDVEKDIIVCIGV